MKISWSNVVEHGTALSVITKGSQVYAPEIGLKWEMNDGDWYNPVAHTKFGNRLPAVLPISCCHCWGGRRVFYHHAPLE
jgi:hypothetical protein